MIASAKTIEVMGLPVTYLEAGVENSRSLILLHGGIGDAEANWGELIPALASDYHIVAPNLPGFSGSAPLPSPTTDGLVRWLRELLDELDLEDAVLVGSFFGGLLARLLAASAPQYVPALVLLNGGAIPRLPGYLTPVVHLPFIGEPMYQGFARAALAQQSPEKIVYVRETLTDHLTESWRANTAAFLSLLDTLLRTPLPAERTPPVPTLLLWGVEDQTMTQETADRLKAEIPGARLEPVAECGALPQIEAADAVAFQITSFLDHLSRPSIPVMPGVALLHANST